jgi:hypothetical protein
MNMALRWIQTIVLAAILFIGAVPVSSQAGTQRSEQLRVSLVDAGTKLAVAVRDKDINAILRFCGSYEVAIEEDRYLNCRELRVELTRQANDNDLYCRLFDSACNRRLRQGLAERTPGVGTTPWFLSARDIFTRQQRIVAKGILQEAGGVQMGTVSYELAQDAKQYGWLEAEPYAGFVYVNGTWILTRLFTAI